MKRNTMNFKYKLPIAIGMLSLMAMSCQNAKEEQKTQEPARKNQLF